MGSCLPTLLFKLRGLDFYPGGTSTHWFMPALAGRTLSCTDFVGSPGIVGFLAICKFQKLLILNDLSCGKIVRLPPPPPIHLNEYILLKVIIP
jgi:hypothetical protein